MNSIANAAMWRMILDNLAARLGELGATGWIVGGSLRDALLGLPVRDIDLAVTVDPLALARELVSDRNGSIARLQRATIRVVLREFPQGHLDIVRLRGSHIEDDLALRDFRVNALALPLWARESFLQWLVRNGETQQALVPPLVDPYGGLSDLGARRLDVVRDSAFRDDPGRILRGARLKA